MPGHLRNRLLAKCLLAGTVLGAGRVAALAGPRGRGGNPSEPSANEFVRRVEESYRNVRSLRAAFTQTYAMGGRTRTESGIVYFARGGLMRWDYHQPEPKLFLCDGKELLLYIPDEKQLTRTPAKSSEDVRVPFRLLLSRLNLKKVFSRIELADAAAVHAPGDHVLRAFPRRGYEEDYREVLMELTPQYDIRRLKILYPNRGTMEFEFDHIQRNAALSPSLFHFTPPAGTEVIKEH